MCDVCEELGGWLAGFGEGGEGSYTFCHLPEGRRSKILKRREGLGGRKVLVN